MASDNLTRRTALTALAAPILLGNDQPPVGSRETLSSFDRRVAALRMLGGTAALDPADGNSAVSVTGGFSNGLSLDGGNRVLTPERPNVDAVFVGNVPGSVANEYYNRFALRDFNVVGLGKRSGSSGLNVTAGADMIFTNFRARNFDTGILLNGGLDLNFYSPVLYRNGIGVRAFPYVGGRSGSLPTSLGSNANNFYGIRIWQNDQAVSYDGSRNTAINFFGGTIESNNAGGSGDDGVKVVSFTNAGIINMIGVHSESNRGQYGYYFSGADSSKVLVAIGNEIIDTVDTNVHIAQGTLCSIGNRIYNNKASRCAHIGDGAFGTFIDSDTTVSGDLSHVLSIRFGRLTFGANSVPGNPPIYITAAPITAAGNVAMLLRHDAVQIQAQSEAGVRTGYLQFTTADHTLSNTNSRGGWAIRGANVTRLWVGRGGSAAVEPGTDRGATLGSPAMRFSSIYAATGTISTSDRREKQQVRDLSERERSAAQRCKSLLKSFKFNDAVQEKGQKARTHIGVIAQDIVEAFAAEGLDAHDYALLCYDRWQSDATHPAQTAGERYGIRYEELLAFMIAAL